MINQAMTSFISIFSTVYDMIKEIFTDLGIWNYIVLVIIIWIIIEYIVESGDDDE